MRLRYRNGEPLYGKTLQTVLAERPCRVIVVAEPQALPGAGRRRSTGELASRASWRCRRA